MKKLTVMIFAVILLSINTVDVFGHIENCFPLNDISDENEKEYWGLLIGVDEYYNFPEDSFIEMKLCIERLYQTLLLSDFWQEDHIKIIMGRNATRDKIIEGFQWLDAHEDENDVCFICYTGHGIVSIELFPPFDEEDRYDGYLSTYWTSEYTSKQGIKALIGLYTTTISDDKLNRLLNNLESEGVCVSIWACQGGEFDDSQDDLFPIISLLKRLFSRTVQCSYDLCQDLKNSGRVVLMPCQEDEGVDGTWFMDFLVKGFQGFADKNKDGLCTAEEAFNYSAPFTIDYSTNYTYFPTYPSIFDDYPGELILTQSKMPPSTPEISTFSKIGEKGNKYKFFVKSIDPEGDLVRYFIEWGDGTIEYSDFYASNETVEISHSWDQEGVFNFYLYSEDIHGSKNFFPKKNVITITDEDIVDQEQLNESFYTWYPVCDDLQVAQSFKPKTDILTKIAVPIFSRWHDPVFLYVKNNLSDEENLATYYISIPPTNIDLTKGVHNWSLFDFPDIAVNKNETYYFICKTDFSFKGGQRNLWASNSKNVYSDGNLFYSIDSGKNWHSCENEDFCFVTFGK